MGGECVFLRLGHQVARNKRRAVRLILERVEHEEDRCEKRSVVRRVRDAFAGKSTASKGILYRRIGVLLCSFDEEDIWDGVERGIVTII